MSKKSTKPADSILEIRKKIDAIDEALWQNLQARAKWVLEIGKIKSQKNSLIYRPEREMKS